MLLLCFADFFKITLKTKILKGTLSECQIVWIQIRILSVLIRVTVCAKVISRRQKSPLARKELKMKMLLKSHRGLEKMKSSLYINRLLSHIQCGSTVKPVLSGHSKIDKKKFFKTNGSLMKV